MFQHPAWYMAHILVWVGLYPFLRLVVYPNWELKPFITSMEAISALIMGLQLSSLVLLRRSMRWHWDFRASWKALGLWPVIWLGNALILWLLTEFRLVQDPLLEPLYDSQLFIRRHPISWTALSFLASAVFEEIFFRGFLPDFLQRRARRSTAILLSALLFSVAHLSLHFNVQAFLAYFLFALSLSYVRTFHGLGAAIAVHLLNNGFAYASQVFQLNLLQDMARQPAWLYLALGLLLGGLVLVIRDFKEIVDKGANAP